MIKTHNYYVDFLKAFNAFILNIFNPEVLGTKSLQKIEYNIGSKTLLRHNLYGNESYNYPNAIIDLQDIRVAEGVSTISRNAYGLFASGETNLICDNATVNQAVLVETQRYLLNLNVQINVESNADMFNFYHIVTNHLPINFTFVDFSFYYFIDVSEYMDDWDFINDDIFNVIKLPDQTQRDQTKYFSLFSVQPQIEVQSISKMEDKENNRYSITFSILAATQIPIALYGKNYTKINRILIDINPEMGADYPILLDIDLNKYKNVKKSIILNRDMFKKIYKETASNKNAGAADAGHDTTNETYKQEIGYKLEIKGNLEDKLLSLYFNPDIIDIYKDIVFLPLDSPEIKLNYNKENDITEISIYDSYYKIIKKYLENEQYIEKMELIQLFIN